MGWKVLILVSYAWSGDVIKLQLRQSNLGWINPRFFAVCSPYFFSTGPSPWLKLPRHQRFHSNTKCMTPCHMQGLHILKAQGRAREVGATVPRHAFTNWSWADLPYSGKIWWPKNSGELLVTIVKTKIWWKIFLHFHTALFVYAYTKTALKS